MNRTFWRTLSSGDETRAAGAALPRLWAASGRRVSGPDQPNLPARMPPTSGDACPAKAVQLPTLRCDTRARALTLHPYPPRCTPQALAHRCGVEFRVWACRGHPPLGDSSVSSTRHRTWATQPIFSGRVAGSLCSSGLCATGRLCGAAAVQHLWPGPDLGTASAAAAACH